MISLSGAPLGLPQAALSAVSSGFGSLAAFAAALANRTKPHEATGLGLLRRSALRALPPDLPDANTRRAMVSVALRSGTPEDVIEPPSRRTAMVRMLRRSMDAAGRHCLHDLTDNDTAELILLMRLMRAGPAEAGALAQLFARPDVVLDLRDEYLDLGKRRAAFERDKQALQASINVWNMRRHHYSNMTEACRAIGTADTDLWHLIVQADPLSADALWCVTQPECDRATVGLYMAEVARTGRLVKAVHAWDKPFIDTMRAVLKRWCAGGYANDEIGLTREDLGGDPTIVLSETLDQVAILLDEPRWTEPCGLFVLREGRFPRDRSHWDISTARMIRPPDSASYLETHLI